VQRTMLKSKIHRATVTDANLEYEGSVTIDVNLMKAADIWPFERVEIYNIANGARFATYAIEGAAGSGIICINGAAAHLAGPGHKVIIASYITLEEKHLRNYQPKLVYVDSKNQQKRAK
jgi:aspartate 1-decarboxylase